MNYRNSLVLALLTTGFCGCAKNGGNSPDDHPPAAALDVTEEPAITADTHFAAGQLAESRGELTTAMAQYKKALELDHDHLKTLYRLGCVYVQAGKLPESVATWKRYLTATEESAFAYSNLAFTEELAGNPAAAEADYKHGIAKEPTNQPCRVNYGLMLARHGRIGEATIQLQAVLSPAEVHYNIASVYELQHRSQMAKLEYQKALAVDPNFVDAKSKLASLGESPAGND